MSLLKTSPTTIVAITVFAVLLPTVCGIGNDAIEQRIRQRIDTNPNDAVGFRLLGRVLQKRGDLRGAHQALEQSLALDNENPASHFQLATLLLSLDRPEKAIDHLNTVVDLVPESDYAADASARLRSLENDPRYRDLFGVELTSFEQPWRSAPQADDFPYENLVPDTPTQRFYWALESGVMFNSNVELAPISRQLASSELGGFQGYLAPDFEFRFLRDSDWQIATLFDSYFNLNEGPLQGFNLQHFKPSLYVDHAHYWGSLELIKRVQYDYSIDLFNGQTFGNRHALTTSLTAFHEAPITDILYWTIDYTDYQDDGTMPSLDSVDGFTNTVGVSRSWDTEFRFISEVDIGADVQWAELTGADQKYRGVFLYAGITIPMLMGIEMKPTAGWGYRDYPDFTGTPSRNENMIVAGVQFQRAITDWCRFTTFFSYDEFSTPNDTYSASRYTTGMFFTFEN